MMSETLKLNNEVEKPSTSFTYNNIWHKLLHVFKIWHLRQKGRIELSNLEGHILDDIGLSKTDVENEINKPFWVK